MHSFPDTQAGLLTNIRLLLIESDKATAAVLLAAMARAGFEATWASTGDEGLLLKAKLQPHIVLMDVALPDVSGMALLSRLSTACGCGIIVLSSLGDEADRVVALELGADDWVAKPARLRELMARVRAVHRRVGRKSVASPTFSPGSATVLTIGPVQINLAHRTVHGAGNQRIMLTSAEYAALKALACAGGVTMSRDALSKVALNRPWLAEDRSVDQLMFNLRRKLPTKEGGEPLIQSIRGSGYWMRAPDSASPREPVQVATVVRPVMAA